MNFEEIEEKLIGWRKARAIDENSTPLAQMVCYNEEREELKDALGDMVVTLINARAMGFNGHTVKCLLDEIEAGADQMGVDLEECIQMAWDEIKDRVGLVRSTGKFTKWRDLNHQERLEVAKSGQLMNSAQVALQCKASCTESEWAEIEAIEDVTFNR